MGDICVMSRSESKSMSSKVHNSADLIYNTYYLKGECITDQEGL